MRFQIVSGVVIDRDQVLAICHDVVLFKNGERLPIGTDVGHKLAETFQDLPPLEFFKPAKKV